MASADVSGSGISLVSPDGTRHGLKVANDGTLSTVLVPSAVVSPVVTRNYAGAGTLEAVWTAPATGTPDGYEIVGDAEIGSPVRQVGTSKAWSGLSGRAVRLHIRPYVLVGHTGSEDRVYGPESVVDSSAAVPRADTFIRADQSGLGTPSDGGSAWTTVGALNIVSDAGHGAFGTAGYGKLALGAETTVAIQFSTNGTGNSTIGYAGFLLANGKFLWASMLNGSGNSANGVDNTFESSWNGTSRTFGHQDEVLANSANAGWSGFKNFQIEWDGTTFTVTRGSTVTTFTPSSTGGSMPVAFIFGSDSSDMNSAADWKTLTSS